MFSNLRRATQIAGLATAGITVGLVLAGCGSSSSSSSTAAAPPAATTAAGPTRISIVFKNGAVVGGLPHEKVKQGDRVVLFVKADVSDEVHLHGYDIMRDVAPGKPATIAFTAKIPGRFEAELEGRSLQILDLEVRP
jgi:hypothetical protein